MTLVNMGYISNIDVSMYPNTCSEYRLITEVELATSVIIWT
jgi:hypothetical protein